MAWFVRVWLRTTENIEDAPLTHCAQELSAVASPSLPRIAAPLVLLALPLPAASPRR